MGTNRLLAPALRPGVGRWPVKLVTLSVLAVCLPAGLR
jgi:hypothetical protein